MGREQYCLWTITKLGYAVPHAIFGENWYDTVTIREKVENQRIFNKPKARPSLFGIWVKQWVNVSKANLNGLLKLQIIYAITKNERTENGGE